jgi:glycosyltransferase involved in cell wall biosynthesis
VKVLWVSAEPPDRSLGGGSIRQAYLLTRIAAAHETHLLLAGDLPDEAVRRSLASYHTLQPAPQSQPYGWRRRMLDLRVAGPEGPPERRDMAPARRSLAGRVPSHGFDAVVVQHSGLAPLLPSRRAGAWVSELHNVGSLTLAAWADLAPGRRQAWVRRQQAARARRLERWITDAYDAVVTVSAQDAAALSGQPHVVPNGVDTAAWAAGPLPEAPRVLFSGTLDYLPNVDGVEWFCREVWPLVRANVPAATLDVVGRRPVPAVRALDAIDGVSVHADVPDVRVFAASARVAVVPLRTGSGTRLKVLEAWAAARPVVGTSVGLAGLSFTPGVEAVVADTPQALAAGVTAALTDDPLASRLALAGRSLVERRYDWSVIGATYAGWLADLSRRLAATRA